MSLKALSTDEMVALSDMWVTPDTPQHKAWMAAPEPASLMPRLTQVHQQLVQVQKTLALSDVKQSTTQIQTLDAQHDALVRQIFGVMKAFAQVAISEKEQQDTLDLLALVLPEGVSVTVRSLRHEAGAAKRLAERLTDAHRASLKSLPLPHGRSVLDLVDELLRVGKELGTLEEQRRKAQQASQPVTGSDVVQVRNGWIRLVNHIVEQAELIALAQDQFDLIFGALLAAKQAALQRRKRKEKRPQPDAPQPDTPQPDVPDKDPA